MPLNVVDFGAKGDGLTLNTRALQEALDAAAQGGGEVRIPAGLWLTGMLFLRSRTHLHLEAGATLLGSEDPYDYPDYVPANVVSRRVFRRRLILGDHVEDVALTGFGTIDGNGGLVKVMPNPPHENRPCNLQFICSRGITVRDLTLVRSGSWMQQYLHSDDILLDNLRVRNHGNKTNDGCDLDGCHDVRVSNCDIDSHDDALVFKSTGPRACERILVTNCRLASNCHGLKFGTESVGGFEDIQINQVLVTSSRFKAPMSGYPEGRPAITGCALECTDGGSMRRISIRGLQARRVFAPLFIKLGCRLDRRLEEDAPPASVMEDLDISDFSARESGPFSSSISGYPGRAIRRVRLDNLDLEYWGGAQASEILRDVPDNPDRYPEITMFGNKLEGPRLPSYGLFLRDIEGISLRDVRFHLRNHDARAPIAVQRVRDLRLNHVRAGDKLDDACLHRM